MCAGYLWTRFKLTEHMLSACRCIVASFIPHFSASLLHRLDATVSLETNLSFVMRAKLGLVCVLFMIESVGTECLHLKMQPRKRKLSGVLEGSSANSIGHFRVHLTLHFKAILSAKSLLWNSVFIHIEVGTNYHNKNFPLRLALKERLKGTQKWHI